MKTIHNHIKRWLLPMPIKDDQISNYEINNTLLKVLCRRGIDVNHELNEFLAPSDLPKAEDHFKELEKASLRIIEACKRSEKIAICGDYDADGITSSVLLVELLNKLGAEAIPFIPSRQEDGYGLNIKMINEIKLKEINLIITVDNGISAFDAIQKSNELGIDLIITDHHKIPNKNIDIFALIHPERLPSNSPYKYLAGVGLAYILAINICDKLNFDIDQTSANALFCIGTVADMAPLIGANRKILKDCLPQINSTKNNGIISIIKKLDIDKVQITSDDIGYKIAPLINAVGRIGDPKLIIDLLTNESLNSINELTKQCFAINIERKRITALVEHEAMEIAQNEYNKNKKFLVLTKREWHPGIIGIVAARVVDKFNLPTAIVSEANDGLFRGSIRSNNLVKVNLALDKCNDILIAHGGHSAAAGFTIKEENIPELMTRLNKIAISEMNNCDLNKFVKPDAYLHFKDINDEFYNQLMLVGPYGIMNPAPIFWTRKCKVIEIFKLKGNHMKMKLDDSNGSIDAIMWNYSRDLKKYDLVDIAFHIEINRWNNMNKLQLNLIDIKMHKDIVDLKLHNRYYKCQLTDNMEVLITNSKGDHLSSDLSFQSSGKNNKKEIFAKKILSFAEIALGKSA